MSEEQLLFLLSGLTFEENARRQLGGKLTNTRCLLQPRSAPEVALILQCGW